jgi:hypothetical protein
MKKVIFTLEGKRFEIELENSFADYVIANLQENEIRFNRNNEASKFLKAYLKVMKENHEIEEHIKILINHTRE